MRVEEMRDATEEELKSTQNYIKSISYSYPRWISVAERLPKTDGYYLVTYKYMPYGLSESIRVRQAYYYKDKFDLPKEAFIVIGKREVLAWMPLPEPYKEDAE